MTVEHDAEHDDVEATCTEDGHKYYKTSYTFNAKAIFSNAYTQTLPALGHNMSEDVTFNDSKSIYQKDVQEQIVTIMTITLQAMAASMLSQTMMQVLSPWKHSH